MSAAIAMMPEIVGLQDAASLLLEAISAARINRQQKRYRTKLRRVLRKMWRAQRDRMEARWFPSLKASGVFKESCSFWRSMQEANTEDELMLLLGRILSEDEGLWGEELATVLGEIMILAARAAAADLRISTTFAINTQRIEDEIRQHAAQLVSGLNDTTRAEMRTLLEKAVKNQYSYTETAKLLRQRFAEFGTPVPHLHLRDRAELIAVTEIGNAYIRGQKQIGNALVQAGVPMEKAWLTAEDDRVEADCESNGAAGWVSWDETFPSGHDTPLAHPGCRCALQMQRKGD